MSSVVFEMSGFEVSLLTAGLTRCLVNVLLSAIRVLEVQMIQNKRQYPKTVPSIFSSEKNFVGPC